MTRYQRASWPQVLLILQIAGIFLICGGLELLCALTIGPKSTIGWTKLAFLAIWFATCSYVSGKALYVLHAGLYQLVCNRRLFRPQFRSLRNLLARVTAVSKVRPMRVVSRSVWIQRGLLALILYSLIRDYHILLIGLSYAIYALYGLIRTRIPPVMLLLAESQDGSTELQWKMKTFIRPNRVVSLLSFEHSARNLNPTGLYMDQIRSSADEDWWTAVTNLMQVVPFIVVDGRTVSKALVREATFVINAGLQQRCLFIGHTRDNCPLLSALGDGGADVQSCTVVREDDAIAAVRELLAKSASYQLVPPSPTLSKFVKEQLRTTENAILRARNRRIRFVVASALLGLAGVALLAINPSLRYSGCKSSVPTLMLSLAYHGGAAAMVLASAMSLLVAVRRHNWIIARRREVPETHCSACGFYVDFCVCESKLCWNCLAKCYHSPVDDLYGRVWGGMVTPVRVWRCRECLELTPDSMGQ